MDISAAPRLLEAHGDFAGATSLVDVVGLSSPRVERFLNALVAALDPAEAYLEIGTYRGRTLCAAALDNVGKLCVGVDKFRFWGRFTGFGWEVRRSIRENVARYRPRSAEVRLFDMDAARFLRADHVGKPVGVYFYDGDHSYRGTFEGIARAKTLLAKDAIVLVDDWNDPTIRKSTHDAFDHARMNVTWSRELAGAHDERGFWNGLGVFGVRR